MSKNKLIIGLMLVALGVLLLLRGLGIFHFTFGSLVRNLMPFAIIAIGISMIVRKRHRNLDVDPESEEFFAKPVTPAQPYNANIAQPARVANVSIGQSTTASSGFSDSERQSKSADGTNGGWVKHSKLVGDMYLDFAGISLEKIDVSSFLGSIEIKLIDGTLIKGLNRLVVSGFIGDIRIFLPRETAYMVQCSNFIGDIEVGAKRSSGISNRIDIHSQDYEQAESKLFIATNSFLGDIRIYIL